MLHTPSNVRQLARALAAFLTVAIVLASGTLATVWQIRQSEKNSLALAARSAVSRTDRVLDEANKAALQAQRFLSFPCSADIRNELDRLTIQHPYLRVISLLQGAQLTCSSFGTQPRDSRRVDLSQFTGHRLSLRPGSIITPDSPLLILLTTFPVGEVAVSVGAPHLTEILSLLSTQGTLNLQVGNQQLTLQGILEAASEKPEHSMPSARYPYSVVFAEPAELTMHDIFEKGGLLLILFAASGILSGALVWKLSFRLPTTYDQLAQAIRRHEIIPWYQPVINASTGEIYGVEVLARWKHSSGVFIPPDVFIPQAEKSGLIIPLTRQLMNRASSELAPLAGRLHQPFHIAFNISTAHIRAGQLTVDDFGHFRAAFPEGSIQLIAEITEREPFDQTPDLDALLLSLRQQGVQVALDDFGTGYSNLGYLNTLPIDYIKIDRSFVNRLREEDGPDKLLDCVIGMVRVLGLGIVAEGVETEYQAAWLSAHDVPFLQGYYFSRPLPAGEFIRLAVLQGRRFTNIQEVNE